MEYLSKQLNAAECNYQATEHEFVGLIQTLRTCRQYLLGRNVTVGTDHASLQWLTTQPHLSHRQVYWLTFMSEFDLTISHVPGKLNFVADALSRRCNFDPTTCATVMMGTESDLLDTIRNAQEHDQTTSFCDLRDCAVAGERGMHMHEGLVCR